MNKNSSALRLARNLASRLSNTYSKVPYFGRDIQDLKNISKLRTFKDHARSLLGF